MTIAADSESFKYSAMEPVGKELLSIYESFVARLAAIGHPVTHSRGDTDDQAKQLYDDFVTQAADFLKGTAAATQGDTEVARQLAALLEQTEAAQVNVAKVSVKH